MRNDREKVLQNLRGRAAVFPDGTPAGRGPDSDSGLGPDSDSGLEGESFSEKFFPDAGGGGSLAERFIWMAEANAATTVRVSGMDEIPRAAADWLRGRGAALRMVCAGELAELDWSGAGIAAEVRAPADGDQAGATRVVAAAADTGAMLQVSDSQHSLTLSLLPPLHFAVVRAADILADLESVWSRMLAERDGVPPRAACLIGGPSRTADIEQTLVLGAHGPLALHAAVVGN